ncbi:MAG TPA: hypothetical protein VMZ52_13475 [Bryobacteraceae bacterium]|nr:hypothetical protein [Bryobacteraceae bacterium]
MQRREQAARGHEAQFRRIGNVRLLVAIAGAFLAWWNPWLLPLPVAAFVALLVYHERVSRRLDCERRAIAYYQRGLARLDNNWAGAGPAGERFRDAGHAYTDDLDVFGHASLFQLLSAARTAGGEATLAGWLKHPSSLDQVLARQKAVMELRPRLDLREDLALLGEEVEAGTHPEALIRWGNQPAVPFPAGARVIAALFAAATAASFSGYMLQAWSLRSFLLVVLLQSGFALYLRDRVRTIIESVDVPAEDLRLLAQILQRLEAESFTSEQLTTLRKQLETDGLPPSRQIARLHRTIERHDWSLNQMFLPVARLLLWSTQSAMALEAWRARSGPAIGLWVAAVGELEALCSLSGYSAEHPADPFPKFVTEGPVYAAEGLAHPLLPVEGTIANDLCLNGSKRLLLVSGSNMSGKSTLLRSVGLNAVLAWTGAPVRAKSLRISPLSIGASMRVQDSLQDGKSRFYAEITRLRQIVDLAGGESPLLFLLDELLSGTNSHDRLIGAEALVRGLVEKGAIGLVTTHDLALAHIVESLGDHAANVHFEDHLENGRIAFDFRMRPGIVEKSNAIELMRSVGLDV